MIKQDRQAPRTTTDLERRYNFGKSFAEIMGIAQEAVRTAREAERTTAELDENLTQREIFLRLTNNGKAQGLFLGDDGELYINADYISAGVFSSQDGTLQIDLGEGKMKIGNLFEIGASGLVGYGPNEDGELVETLHIVPGTPLNDTPIAAHADNVRTKILSYDCDLHLMSIPFSGTFPYVNHAVRIGYDGDSKVVIMGKTLQWVNFGDGEYYLMGIDEEAGDAT